MDLSILVEWLLKWWYNQLTCCDKGSYKVDEFILYWETKVEDTVVILRRQFTWSLTCFSSHLFIDGLFLLSFNGLICNLFYDRWVWVLWLFDSSLIPVVIHPIIFLEKDTFDWALWFLLFLNFGCHSMIASYDVGERKDKRERDQGK